MQLDISITYAQELRYIISAPRKVFFIDNSGSMGLPLKQTHLPALIDNHPVTRYDELREFMKIAIPLMAVDSPTGITIVFLNPPNGTGEYVFRNIHTWDQIAPTFSKPPNGGTPLVTRLGEQMRDLDGALLEQGALFLIATDGEPNEGRDALYRWIANRPRKDRFIVNFLVCTDNDNEVVYLDRLDKKVRGVDVCDDFDTEKQQVLRAARRKGKRNPVFTYSDYVAKACVGAASKTFDKMDEHQGCCTIC